MDKFLSQQDITHIIGKNIRSCRKNSDLTQSRLAELCDLHDNTIKNIEAGKITPNIFTMYKIAKVFNKNLDHFLIG